MKIKLTRQCKYADKTFDIGTIGTVILDPNVVIELEIKKALNQLKCIYVTFDNDENNKFGNYRILMPAEFETYES